MSQMLNHKRWITLVFILIFVTLNSLSSNQPNNSALAFSDDEPTPTPTPDDGLGGMPGFEGGSPVDVTAVTPSEETTLSTDSALAAPIVTFWYNDNQDLAFGQNGNPQQHVNILGNVRIPGVTNVTRIEIKYKLNGVGGFKGLAVGGDKRRLGAPGDFNIELDYTDLNDGLNTVLVRATNTETSQSQDYEIEFTYHAGNSPNENYTIDWASADSIHDVAQVVDGQWTINNDGTLSPNNLATGDPELKYDRLVAIGDVGWTDYEVTVPMTIHGVDTAQGFKHPSNGPGVGMILRWQGHYDQDSEQPNTGWHQVGALGWFRWGGTADNPTAGLQMIGWSYPTSDYPGGGNIIGIVNEDVTPNENDGEYMMKMSVQTLPSGDYYRLKVWPLNQNEPSEWNMEGLVDDPDAFDSGSVVLVSHHIDVSFGDVTVKPLTAVRQTIHINNPANGSIVTNPDQADFEFGTEVEVTAVPNLGYEFVNWTGDLSGTDGTATLEMIQNYTISAVFQPTNAPFSDDFNACLINDALWTKVNPSTDSNATFSAMGEQLELFVPSGSSHDIYPTNENAIRLMQSAENDDFVVEVKFDSVLNSSKNTVLQGILIEQDADNYIRFDFQSTGSEIIIYHASVSGPQVSDVSDVSQKVLSGNMPYMKITRTGNQWQQYYKLNEGDEWVSHGSPFNQSINVNSVGIFGGNAGSNPAHTVVVDYFYNGASPGTGDVISTILQTSASPSIGGFVIVQTSNYGCGDSVTVEAVPEEGWTFAGWTGDLSGMSNPATLSFDVGTAVIAKFNPPEPEEELIFLPFVTK